MTESGLHHPHHEIELVQLEFEVRYLCHTLRLISCRHQRFNLPIRGRTPSLWGSIRTLSQSRQIPPCFLPEQPPLPRTISARGAVPSSDGRDGGGWRKRGDGRHESAFWRGLPCRPGEGSSTGRATSGEVNRPAPIFCNINGTYIRSHFYLRIGNGF